MSTAKQGRLPAIFASLPAREGFMYVKELWHYPIKSMAGERLNETEVTPAGFPGDRKILVIGAKGRVLTSRTKPQLLGLKGTLGPGGAARISGHPWDSPEALELVKEAAGADASLLFHEGVDRFDILPLLVATDGAIAHMDLDRRRFRPNILIGGVEGLEERKWPGRRLRVGNAIVEAAQLRARCVMTTYDPDTQKQDLGVLKRIVKELDGTLALDCSIVKSGLIREGDSVELVET